MLKSRILPPLAIAFTLMSCTAGSRDPAPRPTSSIAAIAAALRAQGVDVREVETLDQPFFGVPAHIFTANAEDLQMYEFATATDAERAASQVDPGGSSIGTTKMSWLAAPHFFRKDRVIAIHLGSSSATRAALESVMGKAFAGHE